MRKEYYFEKKVSNPEFYKYTPFCPKKLKKLNKVLQNPVRIFKLYLENIPLFLSHDQSTQNAHENQWNPALPCCSSSFSSFLLLWWIYNLATLGNHLLLLLILLLPYFLLLLCSFFYIGVTLSRRTGRIRRSDGVQTTSKEKMETKILG